jgi:hypothetical protein
MTIKITACSTCRKGKEQTMKHEAEIETAWEIWHLISKLNDLIWDHYEENFIDRYLKDEYQKCLRKQIDDDIPF